MADPTFPVRRNAPSWDVAVSIAALVFTMLLGGFAVLAGLFSLAFLDNCQADTCSADRAVVAVAVTLATAAVIGVIGLIVTIVRIARKKMSWPFAIGTFVLCLLTCMAGVAWYAAAVGA